MRTLVAEAPDPDRRPSIPNQGRFVELPPALQARWFALTRGNALTTVGRTALGEGSIIGQLKEPVLPWAIANGRTPHISLPPAATDIVIDDTYWQPPKNDILERLRRGLDKL